MEIRIDGAGDAIRQCRLDKEIGIRELAEKLGWDRGRLSRYETNQIAMSLESLEEVATALDIKPELLLLKCLKVLKPGLSTLKSGRLINQIITEMVSES